MKKVLLSFADSRMEKALLRMKRQALEMQYFDEIQVLSEKDLDPDFVQQHKDKLKHSVRGFGYWVWKPYIILRALEALSPGDELYYIDAGCHLNAKGRWRMVEYGEFLRKNKLGIAAFELQRECNDKVFTKMDLLSHFGVQDNMELLERGQIASGHVFIVKSPEAVDFIKQWGAVWDVGINMIDDSPSKLPNYDGFVEHRHDQSVLSILYKLNGIPALPGEETWPARGRDWKLLEKYPIWDKRDLGSFSHIIQRFIRKVRRMLQK